MDRNLQKDKGRTSYFGNVKTRLGSKLSAEASQASPFSKQPWEVQPPVALEPTGSSQRQQQQQQQQLVVGRPLTHTPHIRNPKLRQYYLQGTSWDPNDTSVRQQQTGGLSDDNTNSRELPVNTVFSVSSHCDGTTSAENSCSSSPAPPVSGELVVLRGKLTSRTPPASQPCPDGKPNAGVEAGSSDPLAAQGQSPSPEAEYDKLLDVEAVAMPDGQLCLLALPPECCQGEGPDATSYLKLFCRYITDRKGVVLGILLVTPNKIFFDPCKTHSLVKEHGCEEYLLSLSVDTLASVSFYSDISHVHFNCSQQRRKRRTILQKFKSAQSRAGGVPDLRGKSLRSPAAPPGSSRPCLGQTREVSESRDTVGALGASVLSSAATFCCGGPDESSQLTTLEAGTSAAPTQSTSGGSGTLMFVRLRVQPTGVGERQLGKARRDVWFALSQESSDELYAYLTACRPDLCVLEGREDDGEAEHDEEFVLIKDKDDEEEALQTHRSSGDDWEMVLMDDSGDKPTVPPERDPEGLSSIVENSHVLEASHVRELSKELPPRTVGHSWQLTYSTSLHGSSLKSLYRKLSSTESPVLIVIKDALDEVFGAFLSHPLRPSEVFYGTGETFLFMLHPRFKCFRWTGENSFFIKGDLDSFAIGGGSGHFGLWVDENLYLGRSSPCFTFNNCCLSETDDFRVMELEVWTFG